MPSFILQAGIGSMPRLPVHQNPGLEIVVILRGHLLWKTGELIEPVPSGAIYFTLPGQVHGSAAEFEPGHEWAYVIFAPSPRGLFHPDLGFLPSETASIHAALAASPNHALQGSDLIRTLIPHLVAELKNPGLHHHAQAVALARAIVIELVRCVQAGRATVPTVRSGPQERVRKLVAAIIDAPAPPRTLAHMAADCRIGRTQFSTLFRAQTGDSPIVFINRMRVRHACHLLRNTNRSITNIAHETGFGSSQYFSQIFKRHTGGLDARTYRHQISA